MTTTSDPGTPPRRALICGVGGQDGAYLARFLLAKGYEVVGTSRDAATAQRGGLRQLGIDSQVRVVSMAPNDFRSVLQTVVRAAPDEIYNLAGQTSVGLSFDQPVETHREHRHRRAQPAGGDPLRRAADFLLQRRIERMLRRHRRASRRRKRRLFGRAVPMRSPRPARTTWWSATATPMACAPAPASCPTTSRRCAPNASSRRRWFARPAASPPAATRHCRWATWTSTRDWGWAPEYVEVMWLMLQQTPVHDFVIATGRTVSLEYFVQKAFECVGLDWRQHVRRDASLLRPSDIHRGAADPTLASQRLHWQAQHDVDQVIAEMCLAAQTSASRNA